jgi:hypothetical protein
MDQPVKLIPLLCTKCKAPIPAVQDEYAWVCGNCGLAVVLDESTGLKPVEIHYATGFQPNAVGNPFWVADGKVSLNRQTFSGDSSREAYGFWSTPHRFFIPAYNCNMDALLKTGVQFLALPPACQDGPQVKFLPVVLSPADAHAAAEFIVVAIEAGRKDYMKQIDFSLELTEPVLWILP